MRLTIALGLIALMPFSAVAEHDVYLDADDPTEFEVWGWDAPETDDGAFQQSFSKFQSDLESKGWHVMLDEFGAPLFFPPTNSEIAETLEQGLSPNWRWE